MKKQESGKKSLVWLLIAIGALVLVAALVLGIVMLGGADPEPNDNEPSDKIVLYWNVERSQYVGMGVNGTSGRMARSDGYYYVRFSAGGEQVDLKVADYNLIQKIDQLDVMSLEFDEEGIVIGVKNINECTGGLVAGSLYVESIDGNTLVCNTQGTFQGITVNVEMTEDTGVYDVGQTGLLCGMAAQVGVDDEILAIKDYDGKIIYVYTKGYVAPGDVYWNITRKYDSTAKTTTRELDALGCYVFEMAFNGEVITVKTRDAKIASAIDAKAAKCTGLEFDENGYVSAVTNASKVAGGTTFASWAHVFEVNGKEVYAKKLSGSAEGTEYLGTLADNCKIINVSGVGGEIGSYTTVQYGDQVHGLTDTRGRICYLWIINRLPGDEFGLYWNVERQYDSTNKVTKRTPAADGYYYIDVATGGEQLTVKTKDKELATKLDSYAARCFGMKLTEDNEIVSFISAAAVHGGTTFGSWYYVDEIDGSKLTVSRILTGDTEPTVLTGTIAEDVEIINGSTNFTSHCGEYSNLKVGDRVHCLKDLDGNIRVIFIVEKSVSGPLYWNITKKTVKNDMTTRERAEDGYFYFTMAGGGKQYTFKTKDAEIATKIDSYAAKCMGLSVTKSGIITKVHSATAVEGCQGGTKSLSWVDVTSVSGRSIVAKKNQAGHAQDGQIFTTKMASNCKVFNVSSNFNLFCGEETTVRVGDRIHVLHDRNGDATVVFVVERQKQLDEKNTCPCATDVKWEPWDGTTALENNKYYYLTQDVVAPAEGFVLEGISVSLRLDGHTISSDGRCFFVKSGSKLNICDHETRGKLIGSGVNDESGGVIRVYSSTCTVNLWNIDLERKDGETMAKEGGLISCSGTVSLYDCNLSGGEASVKGGNVQVSSSGTFRMFGGTVTGGTAPSGSSMNVTGRTYLEDVTVTGGSGNTVVFNTDKDMVLNGVTIDKASAVNGTVTMMGGMQIGSLNLSESAMLSDGGIEPGSKITLTAKPADTQVVMTGASETGYKALTSSNPVDYVLSYNASKKEIIVTCTIEPKTHTNDHCTCAGNASGLGDHTCTELTGWTEITGAVFENAVGINGSVAGIKFKQDGNYYLSLDYNTSKTICIMPGQNITICLNGCDLSRSSGRAFLVAGTLNITDCSGQGTVSGGDSANGGAVKLVSQGVVNLFGGTLTATGNCTQGGGVVVISTDSGNIVDTTNTAKVGSVFNLYGGTVTGGTSTGGGNIALWHATYFNMYGGTVSGGTSSGEGGNIFLNGNAASAVKLLGGTITGGTAEGNGAGIHFNSGSLTIGGDVKISGNNGADIYLASGKTITLTDYTSTATTSIEMATAGTFAEYGSDISAGFTSVDPTYEVKYSGGKLMLDLSSSIEGHIHCICGGTANGLHSHECSNQIYEAWDKTGSLPSASGTYYLTEDVHLTNTEGHKIGANTINLCLNGHKITGDGRLIWVNSGSGTLNICDHAGNSGSLEAPGVADNNAGGLIRHGTGGAHVGLYNITMRRTDEDSSRVLVKEGGVMSCSGYLDMYNVTMENGYAKKAGNLLVALTSKVVMVNCTIKDGTATTDTGGNIHIGGNTAGNPATVTMIDCSVTGGTSGKTGDGVNLGSANSELHLGGKITITDNDGQNLYMAGSGNLYLSNLAADSKIGITMATAGVIAKTEDAKLADCFISDKSGLVVSHNGTELVLGEEGSSTEPTEPDETEPAEPHEDHCVCGGTADGVGDHTCGTALTGWTALTADTLVTSTANGSNLMFPASGNYYLDADLSLSKSIDIVYGQTITLCLNGHELRDTKRVFRVGGELNICDHTEEGQVIGTTNLGPVFYTYAGGTMNLYSGTLTAATASGGGWGGVGAVGTDYYDVLCGSGYSKTTPAYFNMYGGTITGGIASQSTNSSSNYGNGGNVMMTSGYAEFTMYDGVITDGVTDDLGGGIYSIGKVNLLGGKITGNTGLKGGDIYMAGGTLTVGGDVQIGEIYLLSGKKLTVSADVPLTADASIGVTMETSGVFTTVAKEADKDCFFATQRSQQVTATENNGSYDLKLEAGSHADHCVCGGNAVGVGEHACQTLSWTPLSEALETVGLTMSTADFGKLPSGSYYLDGDVTVTAITPFGASSTSVTNGNKDVDINLCLNGFDIATNASCTFGRVYDTAVLSITDCTGEQDSEGNWSWGGTVYGGTNTNGSLIYTYEKATLNIYGGNFTRKPGKTTTGCGLFVIAMDKGAGTNTAANAAVMNLYNGNIYDGSSAKSGSIHVMHASTLNMYGGTVNGSKVSGDGGNIVVDNSATMNFYGGTVSNGTAGGKGDNIYLSGKLNAFGGTVTGGDVYVAKTDCATLGGTVQIQQLTLADGAAVKLSTEKPLTGDASIGISMVNAEKAFATVNDESMKTFFFNAENENYSVLYKDQGLYLADGHIHCICEGAEAKPEGHQCENITWVALTQKMFDQATDSTSPVKVTSDGYVLDNGGHYYLSEDITIKETLTPGEGNAFSLCLNGKTLKGDGVRAMYFKGTVNLCDCDYTDELVEEETVRTYNGSVVSNRKPTSNSHAAVAYARAGGVLNLYGGNLKDSTADTAKTGAIVYVSGEMNMYGGKISDGNTSAEGGNLCIADSGIVRMYGGEISDGTSVGNGGNIIINSSATLELHGGLITGGTAGTSGKYGGNIRVNGKMVMDGGVISYGTAGEGGNITVGGNGTLRILGGVVENGSAVSGGNISVSGKLSVEENAIVRDGISTGTGATAGGGNIYGYPNKTNIQITGGQILNGKAQKNGANVFVRPQKDKTCILNITGGEISGIHADSGADVHSVSIYRPNNTGTMNISVGGYAKIDDLHLGENRTITIADTGITNEARIGISKAEGTGTVIETVDTTAEINYTEIFYATEESKKTAISGSGLVIEEE